MTIRAALTGSALDKTRFDREQRTAAGADAWVARASIPSAMNAAMGVERYPFAACVMSDAEHFTEVTDGLDPCDVVELVRVYFNALFAPIVKYGGRVVDVKGDGILAVWTDCSSAPQLRNRVCSACLEMAEAVDQFNSAHPTQPLPTRIGVDIGPIAVADLGALACLQRRAVGDPVITSSRLEQLNKELGTRILVSSAVAEGESGHVFRDLGAFRLRGKRSDIRVLELVGQHQAIAAHQRGLCEGFADAMRSYQTGECEAAAAAFRKLRSRYPEDGATRYYARRCASRHEEGLPLDLPRIGARAGLSFS